MIKSNYKPWFLRALDAMRSPNLAERNSLFIGWNEDNGSPYFLSLDQILAHVYLEGRTKAGKTARAICPLLEYFAQRGDWSIIPIDVKGDSQEMYGAVTASALPIRWFTDRVGRSTFTFNVFEQDHWKHHLTPMQKAMCLGTALGTVGSMSGYGVQWFEGSSSEIATYAFERHEPKTLAQFAGLLKDVILDGRNKDLHSEVRRAGLQALNDCSRMGRVQALNQIANPGGIQLKELFHTPQVLYCSLPTAGNYAMSSAICRLILGALLDAALHTERKVPVLVVIDEASALMSGTLIERLLEQGRSLNVHFLISNQTKQVMQTQEMDFRYTLLTNCCVHWHFGEPVKELQIELAKTGGTYKAIDVSETTARHPITRSWTDTSITRRVVDVERLPLNEIKRIGADPRLTFITTSGDEGLNQYQGFTSVVETDFHITREEYERRKKLPWPEGVPGCIVTRMPGLITDTRNDDDDEPPPVPRISRRRK